MKWLAAAFLSGILALAATPIVRVDAVRDEQIVHKVLPPYPPDAHVSGVVKLTVFVGVDGRVQNVKLISGHPLLTPAAIQAARRWQFKPFTGENGEPVRALATIEIPFTAPR